VKTGRRKSKKRNTKVIVAVVAIAVVACLLAYSFINSLSKSGIFASEHKAAIVDQLSDSSPNQTFVQTSVSILSNAGFKVYQYMKPAVNVDFYRNLPSQQFELIILRVHSALNENSSDLVFFTSEPFDDTKAGTTYLTDFMSDPPRLVRARMYEGADPYFGITPSFVDSMEGNFDHTLIIIMGCSGLEPGHTSMAEALIKKGAKVCTGLDGLVSPSYTDDITTRLLQKLFVAKETVARAVTEINSEVGPDPAYNSTLCWYPYQQGSYSVQYSVVPPSTQGDGSLSCLVHSEELDNTTELGGYYRNVPDVYDAVYVQVRLRNV
jgi:hypothetical protein